MTTYQVVFKIGNKWEIIDKIFTTREEAKEYLFNVTYDEYKLLPIVEYDIS